MGCGASTQNDATSAGTDPNANQAFKNQQAEEAASAIGAHQGISSRLQISIKCNNLVKMDTFSKSDPICIMKTKVGRQVDWLEVGRTEIIANSQNPEFVTKFNMTYHFEEMQYLRFEVFDVDTAFSSSDSKTIDLNKQDFQGACEVMLSQMVGVEGKGHWTGFLDGASKTGKQKPSITVTSEEAVNVNAIFKLEMRAEGVVGKDLLSKADPFIRISCLHENGSWLPCFKTEVRMNSQNPRWNMINSTVQQFANGDVFRPLLWECYDYNRSGNHLLIGSFQASLNDVIGAFKQNSSQGQSASYSLVDPAKKDSNSGNLIIENCELQPRPSFLEYISAGAEISFIVAIDYTASNGDPRTPNSLHYIDPSGVQLNQYAHAIIGIGSVIEFYDSDKKFPVYGFGGKQAAGQSVSHCFAANGNEKEPDAHPDAGVAGILQTYYDSIRRITLSGPTLFTPILSEAVALAQSAYNTGQYYILLILTDGVIHDMPNTVETIVRGSNLPLSILIVGVGDADFSAMEALDGDDKRLRSQSGKEASRDIVQFVQLSKFFNTRNGVDQHLLAKELLAEVPTQFLSYMSEAGISPQQLQQTLR